MGSSPSPSSSASTSSQSPSLSKSEAAETANASTLPLSVGKVVESATLPVATALKSADDNVIEPVAEPSSATSETPRVKETPPT